MVLPVSAHQLNGYAVDAWSTQITGAFASGLSKADGRGAIEARRLVAIRALATRLQTLPLKKIAVTTEHWPARRPGCQTEGTAATDTSDKHKKARALSPAKQRSRRLSDICFPTAFSLALAFCSFPTRLSAASFQQLPNVSDSFPTLPTAFQRAGPRGPSVCLVLKRYNRAPTSFRRRTLTRTDNRQTHSDFAPLQAKNNDSG